MNEFEFLLPDVGEGLAEAMIVEWLVPIGGDVVRMEPIVEIETAKSMVEIPSPVDGVMLRHGGEEGEYLEIGEVLAVISHSGTDPRLPSDSHPEKAVQEETPVAEEQHALTEAAPHPEQSYRPRGRIAAAPTVRRRAWEMGIDLSDVPATGPGGRVLASDLTRFSESGSTLPESSPMPAPTGQTRIEKLTPMREAISNALTRAWSEVPLITDLRSIDAEQIINLRRVLTEHVSGQRISYTAILAFIVATALKEHPRLNASLNLEEKTVTYHGGINLGVAVATDEGLSVGVIRGAEQMGIAELSAQIETLAEEARSGKLSRERATGATFTVSNFGQFGGWYGTPLVVPPQVAIAGFGPIKDTVVAVDGVPAVRPTLPISLSADHRLIDGADLSKFVSTIEQLAVEPLRLLGI